MKTGVISVLLIVCCLACKNDRNDYTEDMKMKPDSEMVFDRAKWNTMDGKNYPYRDKMLNDIVYNDTVRELKKAEILYLFGEPSYNRNDENFLYYRITQKSLGPWTLHTKTMVIKLSEEGIIEWIKIHK